MTSVSTKRRPSVAVLQRKSVASKDAELQRLRTAMVHAMDDAEWGYKNAGVGTKERQRFADIARRLKTALEKK